MLHNHHLDGDRSSKPQQLHQLLMVDVSQVGQAALQVCLTLLLAAVPADTGADFFNNNVAPQVDKDKSTTITIATQKSAISEGGKAGESSHGTHVFGTAAGEA